MNLTISSDYFDCRHCGHKIKNECSLITHIKRKHGQNYSSYRTMFGTQTQKQLIGDGRRTRWEGLETPSALKRQKKQRHLEEMIEKQFSPIECKLCGFSNMISITTHVTRKHNLTTQAYTSKFPGAKLYQTIPSVAIKAAEKLKHRHMTEPDFHQRIVDSLPPLPSKVEFWTKRGFSEEEARCNVSARQRSVALLGGDEKFEKMSRASSGERNPMSLISIAKRYNVTEKEAIQLTPCFGRTKEKHPMWGKHHTPESLEKIASSPHLRNPAWRSRREIELAAWCKTKFSCVLENKKIGRWNVDILIEDKKIVIEYFGSWWHADLRLYPDDWIHPFMRKSAKEIRERDKRKLEQLQSLGYNVVVVWENDWEENPEREKERIIDAYNRTL